MWAVLCIALVELVAAEPSNLNYRSPSINHPHLSIRGVNQLHKRAIHTEGVQFTHGVASGDPYEDSVVIWTRAVPPGVDEDDHLYPDSSQVCVNWEISESENFTTTANTGSTQTSGDVDYTVKVIAGKLKPLTFYWYRFKSCDNSSVSDIGRTKTFPGENDEVESLRLAVYSCANYAEGYYNAYGNPARRDAMDYVLFLGDYQYEFFEVSTIPARQPRPFKETIQIEDYRLRIATQRTDEDLRLSHEKFAWIPVWDDHEIANNGWNNGSSHEGGMKHAGITWQQRKENGLRAYFEWMPIRQVALDNKFRIWRNFKYGKLADLIVLDSRYYNRDETDVPEPQASWANRTMLGADQEAWLYQQLKTSQDRGATWKILGNQIQFSDMNDTAVSGKNYYSDGWMDYSAIRTRIIDNILDNKIMNTVFLTGDYHALWTSDLQSPREPYNHESGEGSWGVELATTSVSSYSGYGVFKSYEQVMDISQQVVQDNEQVKWAEGYYRGYLIAEFTPTTLKTDYYSIAQSRKRSEDEIHAATWYVDTGANKLRRPFGQVRTGAAQDPNKLNPWAKRQ